MAVISIVVDNPNTSDHILATCADVALESNNLELLTKIAMHPRMGLETCSMVSSYLPEASPISSRDELLAIIAKKALEGKNAELQQKIANSYQAGPKTLKVFLDAEKA